MIDPLGRIGTATAGVPPLPQVQLGPITFPLLHMLHAPPVLAVHWEILSPLEAAALSQYTLRVAVSWPGNPGRLPLAVEQTLDQIGSLPAAFHAPLPVTPARFGALLRLAGTQQYLTVLPSVEPVRVAVTLTDPSGATATQRGQAP